ncbi:MAG: 2-nitropropane dioxygenase, partial [Myxococcota bacterium]
MSDTRHPTAGMPSLGAWRITTAPPLFERADFTRAIHEVRSPLCVVQDPTTGHVGIALGGQSVPEPAPGAYTLLGALPALFPEWLGDRSFNEAHGTRFPYVAGAMANGIATPRLVIAMARAHMLGFYGAAGLSFPKVEAGLQEILDALSGTTLAWGANLIHSPNEPALEERVADLYVRAGVPRVSASAYMRLTPSIVRYAYAGVGVDAAGNLVRPRHVFAKISRPETARQFLSPAPAAMLEQLVTD